MNPRYSESKKYWRPPHDPPIYQWTATENREAKLLEYIQEHSEKGNPADVIKKIDAFCEKNWMMNLGSEKAEIVKGAMKDRPIKTVLEIGGYCGYSALVFANEIAGREGAKVYTIEINDYYAGIARKIQEHAGLDKMIEIHLATVEKSADFIKSKGPFDMIFIDHVKDLYLPDHQLLEQYGVIQKGCLVVGDNIIYPGSPDYHAKMRDNPQYSSVLYHQYVEYSDIPDAVLVSEKL